MVMCAKCHKRVAVVFVNKLENGNKATEGLCLKCARELGIPVDNMLGNMMNQMGISPEQLESMESDINDFLTEAQNLPSANDDLEDGGAPAIDLPQLFKEGNLPTQADGEGTAGNKKASKGETPKKKYKFLDTYCRNLTRRAANGKLDRIIGRNKELERVIQILCRRQKNNPCLIGEPGVGKTAIAEALAQRIADGDVPYKLKGKQIYLVDLTALVAGTQFRGQFESRILGLLNEVKEAGNVILVIDEVHNIVGAGDAEGSINAANILKPALSRGEVRIIGATTLNEYRKYIEKDSALERRFQPVSVNEPSIEETVEMLEGIKHYYESFHSIKIPDSVIRRAVILSERYITDRYLPDKAIDLLDEAASKLSLTSAALNESQQIREDLLALREERESLESNPPTEEKQAQKCYETIAEIKAKEIKLSERLRELEPSCEQVVLEEADIASVIEIWTGVPATDITENEFEQIDKLEFRLKERIIGQDVAVEAVARAIKRNRAGISYKRKPVSFIFAGPTGVGKTELVKTLAADLFHSPETLIRLDMSEFMEKHSVSRIIGAPPGYVGYDEAGQLTEKIRRRPYSVVLFDEIEKAHPDVLNILLQILDEGKTNDAQGRSVNFANCVIIMTSNAGSERKENLMGFGQDKNDVSKDKAMKALRDFLRPEFLGRVDEIIVFNELTTENYKVIAQILIEEFIPALEDKGIRLTIEDGVADIVANESAGGARGARDIRYCIRRSIEDPIANLIIAAGDKGIEEIRIGIADGKIVVF